MMTSPRITYTDTSAGRILWVWLNGQWQRFPELKMVEAWSSKGKDLFPHFPPRVPRP